MKILKSIFILLLLSFTSMSNAFSQRSLFSFEKYTNDKDETLNYRLLIPDANPKRKYPLVIFLHGSGERGDDNESQLKWGVVNFATDQNMKLHPSIVIAPQCPINISWSNYSNEGEKIKLKSSPTKPMELVIELIRQLIKELPVDTNRIYITGLSMGGFGTFDAIERYPGLFAAAVPVCGGGDLSKATSIAHIPIWIFTGAEDAVVNPGLSLKMVQALTETGGNPGFTQYPEVGHFSWIEAYSDPLMMEWLFRQKK